MDQKPPLKTFEKKNQDSTGTGEALQASEMRYHRLFETARDGILILDAATGQIDDVNPFLLEMLAYSHDEFLGKKLWEIGPFRDIRESRRIFSQLQEKGYVRYEHLPLETKDRRHVDVEFVSNVYQVACKQVIQCNIRDITERKQAEQIRQKLEAQLRVSQKMEAIATLAGGIAHQFNNALHVIIGNLEFLDMDEPSDGNFAKRMDDMQHAAFKMTQLTSQLLAYARGGKYQAENITLNHFIRETLPLLNHTLKSSVRIEAELSRDVWETRVDSTQIQMVLSALLANASEAMEEEGCIKISCENVKISREKAADFSGLNPGDYVDLKIEDNGKGMDEETRKRVFEPFFTTKMQGRGLGLAAAYGIVKNHNGWISVESQLDKGTEVHIYLPAIAEADGKWENMPKAMPQKTTGTILLIEDEPLVMDVIHALLTRLGYFVLKARTGGEALAVSKTFHGAIDLAILDILLPDMNGKEVYHFLMKDRPNLKVIVCSGYSIEGPAQEILDAGAQG
ncbi:MAG: PAS domain S-box protein, partial [Proteobacteria bacterium]|nr:PAS domain S-box protein [Pseudomonadota bacterium]